MTKGSTFARQLSQQQLHQLRMNLANCSTKIKRPRRTFWAARVHQDQTNRLGSIIAYETVTGLWLVTIFLFHAMQTTLFTCSNALVFYYRKELVESE